MYVCMGHDVPTTQQPAEAQRFEKLRRSTPRQRREFPASVCQTFVMATLNGLPFLRAASQGKTAPMGQWPIQKLEECGILNAKPSPTSGYGKSYQEKGHTYFPLSTFEHHKIGDGGYESSMIIVGQPLVVYLHVLLVPSSVSSTIIFAGRHS